MCSSALRRTLAPLLALAFLCMDAGPAAAETTPQPCDVTILGPNPVFVQHGGNLSLNCTATCEAISGGSGWESSLRKAGGKQDTYWISTDLLNITEWVSSPKCFFIDLSYLTRTTHTTVITYQAPKDVSVEVTSEMVAGQPYDLTCRAVNIAPKRHLTVSVWRGNETLHSETYPSDITSVSTSVTVTRTITAQRRDHGAEYTCRAQLDLRPNGGLFEASSVPVPVSVVGPPINVNLAAEETEFREGDNFTVRCSGEGNPPPVYEWHLPTNGSAQLSEDGASVTIFSAQSAHNGTYECTARNRYGSSTAKVDILVKGSPPDPPHPFPGWKVLLIVSGCLATIGAAVIVYIKCLR